jgi:hypothetical protein
VICPQCESEYRDGFWKCTDCDVQLVESLQSAPIDRVLVPLVEEKQFELVGELLDRLEKESLPYVIEAGTALALLDAGALPNDEPQPWEARIYVARSASPRANEILADLRDQARFGGRRPAWD